METLLFEIQVGATGAIGGLALVYGLVMVISGRTFLGRVVKASRRTGATRPAGANRLLGAGLALAGVAGLSAALGGRQGVLAALVLLGGAVVLAILEAQRWPTRH